MYLIPFMERNKLMAIISRLGKASEMAITPSKNPKLLKSWFYSNI